VKKQLFLAAVSIVFAASIVGQSASAKNACSAVFAQGAKQVELMSWRVSPNGTQKRNYRARTQPSQSNQIFKTNAERERQIQEYTFQIKKEVWVNDTEAIGMDVFPEVGTKISTLTEGGDYGSHITPLYKIQNIGADGILHVTLAVPVSGRFGQETTKKWAETDKYDIDYSTNPSDPYARKTKLIKDMQSHDLVMAQELEIPMIKDQEVAVYYERHGSAGSAGFEEGRIMRFIWDGSVQN
jgi:hypothetical protein